jgi:hypothetical protein
MLHTKSRFSTAAKGMVGEVSDQGLGSAADVQARNGSVWNAISWVAAVAGILSVVMILMQGGIVLLGHTLANSPSGTFWGVLIAVTSPGAPIAGLGFVCGAIGWFSAYRKRALIGIAGFVLNFALFALLSVVFG